MNPRFIAAPQSSITLALGGIRKGAIAVALCCAAASCQSHIAPSTGSGRSASDSSGSTASAPAKALDACSMVSAQDITALLGATVPGKPTPDLTMSACSWENTTTDESVTLKIGRPDSAPGNALPAPLPGFPQGTPGPDGTRVMGLGVVEFPSGNRKNTVQVAVVRMSEDQRNTAAADLAKKIAPQIS